MAFTTETDVREKFQLTDATVVPAALITRNIDDAHTVLMRYLDPAYDVPTPDAAVVLGETLLAGALLLRSLASAAAFTRKRVTVGGQRVEPVNKDAALEVRARSAEAEAWEALEPFLLRQPAGKVGDATDTVPLIEEG